MSQHSLAEVRNPKRISRSETEPPVDRIPITPSSAAVTAITAQLSLQPQQPPRPQIPPPPVTDMTFSGR